MFLYMCMYTHTHVLTYVPMTFVKHSKPKNQVLLEIKLSVSFD